MKDYYKILGVDKKASDVEIKKAFSKLAHQYHPDKKGGDEAKFKEANEAYQVLKNKEKRQKYDQFGSADGNPFSGGGSGFNGGNPFGGGFSGFQQGNINMDDLGDIFGDIFGGGGFSGGSRRSRVQKGRDIEVAMEISLEEAVFGVSRTIELKKNVICSKCNGKGGTGSKTCSKCQGSGQIRVQQNTFFGSFQSMAQCPNCEGQGETVDKVCGYCAGKGYMMGKDKIEVKVPAGIDNNQSLRLSGKGEPGLKGAPAGDLYIKIKVKPSSKFTREGETIKSTVRLKYSQLIQGDKISVETVDGPVKLKIPAFTPSAKVFILKNKGVPNLHGRGRGNHLVTVKLSMPDSLTKEQKELIEDLEKKGL
jgi:molecular chaperone DnaJ